MAIKTNPLKRVRRTTTVPVTTMEEIPVLSDLERAELIASLKEAEARMGAGEGIDFDPKTFKSRLVRIYRGARRRTQGPIGCELMRRRSDRSRSRALSAIAARWTAA